MKRLLTPSLLLGLCALVLTACGEDPPCTLDDVTSCGPGSLCKADPDGEPACVPGCLLDQESSCPGGQACEEVEGGEPLCFAQVVVGGKITDALDGSAIAGARVAARDAGGVVVGRVAVSGADGTYALPLRARRNADGSPLSTIYTLRADAAGFHSFPGGLRPALPVDLATATAPAASPTWLVENAATSVALIPVDSTDGLGTVRGRVETTAPGGTLVVAGTSSGVADSTGEFAVFNVPAGTATVRGYAAGVQLAPVEATVTAGAETTGVVLAAAADVPLAKITGSVSLVNAPGGAVTSVALVVEETFVESLEIGQVPPGLRAAGVSGAFEIDGVPDGDYVVLASLDNDGLVRDPDPNIAGTQIVHLKVEAGVPSQNGVGFKVTEALAVRSPGAETPEVVTGTPTFRWADDSSEEGYELRVFDALGSLVWEKLDVPSPKGGADVEVEYAGPALQPGMVYQFRASSMKAGAPISRTEELRGVFSLE